ncbi:Fe(3+) dicitrate ABC transporter ATP-binding protein FecE [Moritella yayanosii]|uniref:Iron-dicitrate transporter subunit ATP-binding component of ABC superfamily KpLE2 phage-like element n=1 Tax=Moritella yayanosii TaxID=69539 RepID=A0A330LMS0_9GAMM|nr:Fe(3+) dicitrate ABC transporter ATP-binding protein FecE [Moritella yayanosii]SQD78294.1 iron-dicitrate transporter subunit; ATP-binding component of ABC superfamily; KpLE2 phage-like element [Moritella yayanosii]
MLTIENLTIGYAGKMILNELNITIAKGKITALIGPNGCGKSTLLKTIAGSLKPAKGKVSLAGQDLSKLSHKSRAKLLSILPQSPITPEGISVRQLVSCGRNPYLSHWGGLSQQDRDAVQAALVDTGLCDLADRSVDSLSGGQRQRVWIAMVLAQDTDYILLDEPTTYLDLTYQIELMEMMRKMNRQGKTLVVVLHDLNQACRYCDHLVVMKKGKIIVQDEPHKIFTSKLLKDVFALNAMIITDPIANKPMCIPL